MCTRRQKRSDFFYELRRLHLSVQDTVQSPRRHSIDVFRRPRLSISYSVCSYVPVRFDGVVVLTNHFTYSVSFNLHSL